MDINGEIDSNATIVGDFNTPLTSIGRSSTQKINKKMVALNDTLDQMKLIDIFKSFHPKATEYTLSPRAHGTFFRIGHMLGHKTSLNKFKKIEIMPIIFSDHNDIKLETKCKKKTETHGD